MKTLAEASSGDIVKLTTDGRLFVVQGFVDGVAAIASLDSSLTIDEIRNSLICDYDVDPSLYDYFEVIENG